MEERGRHPFDHHTREWTGCPVRSNSHRRMKFKRKLQKQYCHPKPGTEMAMFHALTAKSQPSSLPSTLNFTAIGTSTLPIPSASNVNHLFRELMVVTLRCGSVSTNERTGSSCMSKPACERGALYGVGASNAICKMPSASPLLSGVPAKEACAFLQTDMIITAMRMHVNHCFPTKHACCSSELISAFLAKTEAETIERHACMLMVRKARCWRA